MSRQTGTPAFNQVPPNEKVGTMSPQLPRNLKKLLNNLLERGHGFCFEAGMSECVRNGDLVYPEGPKSPSRRNPTYGLRQQTAPTLGEAIARNRKELGYGE